MPWFSHVHGFWDGLALGSFRLKLWFGTWLGVNGHCVTTASGVRAVESP